MRGFFDFSDSAASKVGSKIMFIFVTVRHPPAQVRRSIKHGRRKKCGRRRTVYAEICQQCMHIYACFYTDKKS
jgi:hypothetical protein